MLMRITTYASSRTLLVPLLFFAILTAVTARIAIPLPFTPVPVTLQVLAVLLSGLILGSRAGAGSQLAYLAAIAAGAPLTASGLGGIAAFVAPTAGYLVAFVPAAFVAGWLVEQFRQKGRWALIGYFAASLCGVFIIYLGGVSWLAFLLGDLPTAIRQGLLPFIAVDLLKGAIAALVVTGGRALFAPFLQK
jgi:biotin transport system substrate-specific component